VSGFVVQASRELGIHENVIRKWAKQFEYDPLQASPGQRNMRPEQAGVERLKREVQKLKAERDILNKTAAYFAKDHS
jgi:transposase